MRSGFSHRHRVKLDELYAKSFLELAAIAAAQKIIIQSNVSKWELTSQISRSAFNAGAQLSVKGILQVHPRGFGMIKTQSTLDLPLPSDVYVAPSKLKTFGLHDGDAVNASIRPPSQEESYFSLETVLSA